MATHKMFKDLFELIDASISVGQMTEASAVLTFGHSGGLMPLINAFEIYRDEGNLTVWKWICLLTSMKMLSDYLSPP